MYAGRPLDTQQIVAKHPSWAMMDATERIFKLDYHYQSPIPGGCAVEDLALNSTVNRIDSLVTPFLAKRIVGPYTLVKWGMLLC